MAHTRKPGPVGKGPRKQHTIRFPLGIDARVAQLAAARGFEFNDFAVALVARGLAADVEVPRDIRALVAQRAATCGSEFNELVVELVAKGLAAGGEPLVAQGTGACGSEFNDFVVELVVKGLAAAEHEQLQLSA